MIGIGAGNAGRHTRSRRPGNGQPEVGGSWVPSASGWTGLDLRALDAEVDRPYWIGLSLVPGLGPVSFGRLLRRFGSARAAWEAGDALLHELPRLPDDARPALERLRQMGPTSLARRIEEVTKAAGGRVLIALDPDYPPALRSVDPRPAVLYQAGDASALEGSAVAVVGTRRATGYGRSCAVQIADELARAGVTVVSGLALGVDGEAHGAAMAAGGRSVAVLPSPLDRVYPPRHRQLARRLAATGGAVLSELAPGHLPGKPDFARRNRIIAGLAAATVVVEAPDHSGALLTAAAAVELGRDVYAVPGPIDSVASRGCNRLIADHVASLVTSPAALLTNLGVRAGTPGPGVVKLLSEAEALVLARLLKRPASIEELLRPTGLSTGSLASALTLLEARGLATSYGGATFHPTLTARRLERAG